ncbi:response regulator [Heliobacterium gestii]|uniref:Circadian input-output histidine kinase CikA n=1 Tax=Heliomicrobium gestii TaxID=2699 RepID=A0A845LDR8_HELGE|nr:response regulator [Heliomicrobium gestii]MBM7865438.1 PAS domain S-box-containing protein [Heliomicrobium gestii]MZP41693.1 response regulator [Heliomicrobium gestii]
MSAVENGNGITLLCDWQGMILRVNSNRLGFSARIRSGQPFPGIVDRSCADKALNFLAALRKQGSVFNWELNVPLGDQVLGLYFAGCASEGKLLIAGARTRSTMARLYEEMVDSGSQTPALRSTLKDLAAQTGTQADWDSELYEEVTRLNNELVNLQRVLVKKLEKSEERYRLLAEYASDLISRHTTENLFLYASPACRSLLGYEPEEILGRSGYEFLHPEDMDRVGDNLRETMNRQEPRLFQYRMRRKEGRYVWFESTVRPVQNVETGKVQEVIFVTRDITERKRAEEELQAAKERAETADRAKSAFLATVSHEIRTPLHGIIGMIDLLLDTTLTEEQADYGRTIGELSRLLSSIINDILDFSKIEAGRIELEAVDYELRLVINDVINLLRVRSEQKNLDFTCDIDSEIPRFLRGDPVRLRQVMINLGGNAVKFTEKGKVALRVTATPQAGKSGAGHEAARVLRFEIHDTGVGISDEVAPRLFQPFSQADMSTARRYGGTGLGLAIAKRLVEMMGGEIGFQSISGLGTTFWFTAPLVESPSQTSVDTPAMADLLMPELPEKQILLVEDNPVNQKLASIQLKKFGLRLHAVSNGREAVDAVRRETYSLVLMDCQMPEMDGFEATREIRRLEDAQGGHVPIVAMTARAMRGDREECLACGMDDYISKPIRTADLHRVLNHWIFSVDAAKTDASGPGAEL